jgi:uncharacterized protein
MIRKTSFLIILAFCITISCDSTQKKETPKKNLQTEEKANPALKDTIVDHKELYDDGSLQGEGKALYTIVLNKPKYIKQGKWTLYHKGSGKVIMSEGEYNNGIQTGKWTFYFKDGKKKEEGSYLDGALTGEWVVYYPAEMTGNDPRDLINWRGTYIVIDKKDETTGEVKKVGVLNGKKISFYPKGNPQMVLKDEDYKNGMKNGRNQEYYEKGSPKIIALYKDDKKNGAFNEYWESNKKKAEGFFADDKPTGNWKIFYSTGQILSEGSFSSGKPDGHWKFYSRENQLMKEGLYKDGKEQGLWTLYTFENGKKTIFMELPLSGGMAGQEPGKIYEKGSLVGEGRSSGIPKCLFQVFKNGQPSEIFDSQSQPDDDSAKGIVIKWTGKWKPLKKDGPWIEYFTGTKIKKYEVTYMNDKKNGEFREYYQNGKIKAEGKYLNDKMNDQWKFYNQDGSLDENKSGLYMLDKKR